MKMMRLAAVAVLGLGPPPGPALAQGNEQNPSFNLVNRAQAPIREVYVTPGGDARWGRNRLTGGPIPPGAMFPVRRRVDGNCIFDIRVVFADGRREDRRGLNTCQATDIAVGAPAASDGSARTLGDASLRLLNRGDKPIVEAFAVPAGTGAWGDNRLSEPLASHGERMLRPPPGSGCLYDLRVVFADHRALERKRADLCRMTELAVP